MFTPRHRQDLMITHKFLNAYVSSVSIHLFPVGINVLGVISFLYVLALLEWNHLALIQSYFHFNQHRIHVDPV